MIENTSGFSPSLHSASFSAACLAPEVRLSCPVQSFLHNLFTPCYGETWRDWSIPPSVAPTSTRIWREKAQGLMLAAARQPNSVWAFYGTTKSRALTQSQTL